MKTILATTLALLCAIASGCASRVTADGEHWRRQAARVTIGMPRAEVEELLPPHPMSPGSITGSGGSQSVTYWVDDNWCVTIAFDYTGVSRDENGKVVDTYSPQNRAQTAPVLSREKMPVYDWGSLGTAEEGAEGDAADPAP